MEKARMINDKFNKVRIWQRDDDGKFGIEDINTNQFSFRYRTEYLATKIAQSMSDENDRLDKYEEEHS